MAHARSLTVADPSVVAREAKTCGTCGRRLKPVYPNLVSLGARRVWFQVKLECPSGCESWVYEQDVEGWVRCDGDD